jgi:hypothetical protein
MATPTNYEWTNWAFQYVLFMSLYRPDSLQYAVFNDMILTINQLTRVVQDLENRLAALEP